MIDGGSKEVEMDTGIPESLVKAIRTGLANNQEIQKKAEQHRQKREEQRRATEAAISAFLESPALAAHVQRSLNHSSNGYFGLDECLPEELQSSLNEIAARLRGWGFCNVKVGALGTHLTAQIPEGMHPGEADEYGLLWE